MPNITSDCGHTRGTKVYDIEYCIIFIHIGPCLPAYLMHSLCQARIFNTDCPIVLVANASALNVDGRAIPSDLGISLVSIEEIPESPEHKRWASDLDREQTDYWLNTRRRFLLLYDMMLYTEYHTNVVQLETDNMLYRDLRELLPTIETEYSGIATTFNNDWRCIPGIMFIRDLHSMKLLANCFADYASVKIDDMKIIARCARFYGNSVISQLPIIMPEYLREHPPKPDVASLIDDLSVYSRNINAFNSIFDGSAIGQFLGGTDYGMPPGFITKECVFDPSCLKISWQPDSVGRKVPFAKYGTSREFLINNLHIQSKRLAHFVS